MTRVAPSSWRFCLPDQVVQHSPERRWGEPSHRVRLAGPAFYVVLTGQQQEAEAGLQNREEEREERPGLVGRTRRSSAEHLEAPSSRCSVRNVT